MFGNRDGPSIKIGNRTKAGRESTRGAIGLRRDKRKKNAIRKKKVKSQKKGEDTIQFEKRAKRVERKQPTQSKLTKKEKKQIFIGKTGSKNKRNPELFGQIID